MSLTGKSQFSGEHVTDVVVMVTPLMSSLPTEGLREAGGKLLMVIPNLKKTIVHKVSKQCNQSLEATHTIPRLYRRTNKEV